MKAPNASREAARILLREIDQPELTVRAQKLSDALSINPVTAKILLCRGLDGIEEAREFLSPSLKHSLPDPKQIKNIEAAAALILDSIECTEQITVFSDFDVDGLSSGSQLVLFLRALGAKVTFYTPNRFSEGYGLSAQAIEKLALSGTKLLVSVDCGISNHKEIALAIRRGMKVVVVDHHQPQELPKANVIVNPAQDGCPFGDFELAAAGLTWMLLIVLRSQASERFKRRIQEGEIVLPDPKEFLDLAALGTICDMVPLRDVNRTIAHRGIEAIRRTERPGLVALKRVAGVETNPRLGAGHVGYALGPRINAAGRVGDASQVLELLTTRDSDRALSLAKGIDKHNVERRKIEAHVLETCLKKIEEEGLDRGALAIFEPDFHAGVVGIVAQRLVERFHKPVAVMAPGEMVIGQEIKPVIKGSVRSVSGFNVAEVLESLSHLLLAQGGHAAAGGFTLDVNQLAEFIDAFASKAEELIGKDPLERTRSADIQVSLSELDFRLVQEIHSLAPFGRGNPSPVLVTKGVSITSVTSLSNGHLRLRLQDGNSVLNAVAWGFQGHPLLRKGKLVNLAYSPDINTYQGMSSVQLDIKEVWSE